MFEAAGWQVLTVKYGRRLEALFERAGGEELRRRIDEMPNEEYQRLLRADPAELRERLPGRDAGARRAGGGAGRRRIARRAVRDLGGHDIGKLIDAYRADAARPADGDLRLHDQGLVAAHRGPS